MACKGWKVPGFQGWKKKEKIKNDLVVDMVKNAF